MAAAVTGGTQKEPAKAQGMNPAHRLLAKHKEGKLPCCPEAPMPADGVKALFPIIYLALPGTAEPRSLLREVLCKDTPPPQPAAEQALHAAASTCDPSVLGEALELPSCLGWGSLQDLSKRLSTSLASKARRRGSGSAATSPSLTGYKPKPHKGQRTPGLHMSSWVKDKHGTEGMRMGRQQQLPGQEQHVQHGC